MDEKVAIHKAIKETLIKDQYASCPVGCGMVCMAQHCWWQYMNRDLFVRSIDCKSCTALGKNLKSVIPDKQYQSHKPRGLPNQEIQTDFAGPMNNEKEHEIHLLTCIDKFLKNASVEICEIAQKKLHKFVKFVKSHKCNKVSRQLFLISRSSSLF